MTNDFFVDTHCHLDLFQNIQQKVEAEDKLLIKTISVTNAPSFFDPNLKLFSGAKNIRVALGLHPELAVKFQSQTDLFEKYISHTKYVGEIGLDGSKDLRSSYGIQLTIFKKLLAVIKNCDNKILTIHSRNASKETIEILHDFLKDTNCKVILHWYTGNMAELKVAIDYGFFLSINHKMIGTNIGRGIIAKVPLSCLLTETDAPFTFDDKITNRIDSLKSSIAGVAQIKNITEIEVQQQIYKNFRQILTSVV